MCKRKTTCCMLLGLFMAAPFAFAEEQAQISRLPPLPQPLDPILQDMFDKRRAMGGAIINLTLTTGHAPKFARASGAMAFTIRFETSTPRRLIELVIFRTAQIVGSDYELNQHTPLMKLCGYSDQQIAEVANWRRSRSLSSAPRSAKSNKWPMTGTSMTRPSLRSVGLSRRSRLWRSAIQSGPTTALAS
jgi:hypothetical protein